MSNYRNEDSRLQTQNNPINTINTVYPNHYNGIDPDLRIDYDLIYNTNPTTEIDREYFAEYRSTVENLRTKTETYNDALEACIVPALIPGMAFQPYVYNEWQDDDEPERYKTEYYIFMDNYEPISTSGDSAEYVFNTDMIKFVEDRHRRLSYNRTIHFITMSEWENNDYTILDIVHEVFGYPDANSKLDLYKLDNVNFTQYTDTEIAELIEESVLSAYPNGGIWKDESNKVLISGLEIDSQVVSTFYNLHSIGWIQPALLFINSHAISWTNIIITVDRIDTFLIITNLLEPLKYYIATANDEDELTIQYLHIPFKCHYNISSVSLSNTDFVTNGKLNRDPLFVIDKRHGSLITKEYYDNYLADSNDTYDNVILSSTVGAQNGQMIVYDRILPCTRNIVVSSFAISQDDDNPWSELLSNINYSNRRFKDFCNNDYRCKLKQWNFIGWEVTTSEYTLDFGNTIEEFTAMTLKSDDFSVQWHPFNIMDFSFDTLISNDRYFTIIYNTKVLYDQDNILRLRNLDPLSDEYEKWRLNTFENIEKYMHEIYRIAETDIGQYTDGTHVYTYKTPYAVWRMLVDHGTLTEDLNEFIEKYDTNDNAKTLGFICGAFYCEDFDSYTGESFANALIEPDYDAYLWSIGLDNRGSMIPDTSKGLSQVDEDQVYDVYKFRFKLVSFNNVEEGSTPVDEFIYYYSHTPNPTYDPAFDTDITKISEYDSDGNLDKTSALNMLNALAADIFKYDLKYGDASIIRTIVGLNMEAKYYISNDTEYSSVSIRDEQTLRVASESNIYNGFYFNAYYRSESTDLTQYIQSEWALRRSLPEMFIWELTDDYTLTSMDLLDEVFDFTYGFDKTYEQNLWGTPDNFTKNAATGVDGYYDEDKPVQYTKGTNYILGYDADKLEGAIKRSVVSITRTGAELKTLYDNQVNFEKTYNDKNYKVLTFWYDTSRNARVSIDSSQIHIEINKKYLNREDGIYTSDECTLIFDASEYNYKGQENTTVTVNSSNKTATYVDKGLTVTWTRFVFNYFTGDIDLYNGDEIVLQFRVDYAIHLGLLRMSRWTIGGDGKSSNNYVMIYKDGMLYDYHDTVEYDDISFAIYMDFDEDNNASEDTRFEFVFFLNGSNTVIQKQAISSDDIKSSYPTEIENGQASSTITLYGIPCNTTLLDPEYSILASSLPLKNTNTNPVSIQYTNYILDSSVYSLLSRPKTNILSNENMVSYWFQDHKVNGLYMITKAGGGEYIISVDDSLATDSMQYPCTLSLFSSRQFRHYRTVVTDDPSEDVPYVVDLPDEFNCCMYESHMMVFINGYLTPASNIYLHSKTGTPVSERSIFINTGVSAGDIINVFYVTNSLNALAPYIDDDVISGNQYGAYYLLGAKQDRSGEAATTSLNPHYTYIRLQTPLYAVSSKNSMFIFIDGVKINHADLIDISDTIISINQDISTGSRRMQMLCHLDTQDIVERMYINDGLTHFSALGTTYDEYGNYRPEPADEIEWAGSITSKDTFSTDNEVYVFDNSKMMNYIDLDNLEDYSREKGCLLDELINDSDGSKINKLFYDYDDETNAPTIKPDGKNNIDIYHTRFSRRTALEYLLSNMDKYKDSYEDWIDNFSDSDHY